MEGYILFAFCSWSYWPAEYVSQCGIVSVWADIFVRLIISIKTAMCFVSVIEYHCYSFETELHVGLFSLMEKMFC